MKETYLRIFARVALFLIFYLGLSLAEWRISITEWHVYTRLLFFYCAWMAATIKFDLPKSE